MAQGIAVAKYVCRLSLEVKNVLASLRRRMSDQSLSPWYRHQPQARAVGEAERTISEAPSQQLDLRWQCPLRAH